jgi:hypothetical protein
VPIQNPTLQHRDINFTIEEVDNGFDDVSKWDKDNLIASISWATFQLLRQCLLPPSNASSQIYLQCLHIPAIQPNKL